MRRIGALIAVLGVMFILLPSIGSAQSMEQANKLIHEGWGLCDNSKSKADLKIALTKFQSALDLYEKAKSDQGKGGALRGIAFVYHRLRRDREALAYYEKSMHIFEKTGDAKSVCVTLDFIALSYWELGEHQKVVEHYDKALTIARKIHDLRQERIILHNIGTYNEYIHQYQKALEYYEKAAEKMGEDFDAKLSRWLLDRIGRLYDRLGKDRGALSPYQAIALYGEAVAVMRFSKGTYPVTCRKAFDKFSEAFAYFERSGDTTRQVATLQWMAYCLYRSVWERNERCEKAVTIAEKAADLQDEKLRLFIMGDLVTYLDNPHKALELYGEALAAATTPHNMNIECAILYKMAQLCKELGEYQKALEFYDRALVMAKGNRNLTLFREARLFRTKFRWVYTLFEVTGDMVEGAILNRVALLHYQLGESQKAQNELEKALTIFVKHGFGAGGAEALAYLGEIYHQRGEYQKALECFEKELAFINGLGRILYFHFDEANWVTQDAMANVYLSMGDMTRARGSLTSSATKARLCLMESRFEDALKSSSLWAFDLYTKTIRGLALEGCQKYDVSETWFKGAIESTEEIREKLPERLRSNFYDAHVHYLPRIAPYKGLCRLLQKMGRHEESFTVAESTKARVFSEALSKRAAAKSHDEPSRVIDQDSTINDKYVAALQALEQANKNYDFYGTLSVLDKTKDSCSALTAQTDKGVNEATDKAKKLVEEAREEKAAHIARLRKEYPIFAATKYPQPMALEDSALKEDEWVLEYEVTDSGIVIFLIKGKKFLKSLFKPVERKDLDTIVKKFRDPLDLDRKKLLAFDFTSGKKLADLLLADVLEDLPKGVPLIIVPDDSLGTVPFEALVLNGGGKAELGGKSVAIKGAEFFGDRNPISYQQSVTALTLARNLGKRDTLGNRTFAMVDPVFSTDDQRLVKTAAAKRQAMLDTISSERLMSIQTELGLTFRRLALTGELGESLRKSDPSATDLYKGLDAQKTVLFQKDLTLYKYCVFGTHGYFGKDLPLIQEPILVLTLPGQPEGQDGFLRMSEVMGLKLNADIVALTACQSGLGKQISGEGTMGMGRAFQYAGAKSVLMSLWSVAEKSSVELVNNFFKRLREGKSKLVALKEARDEIRKAGYDHPFFWAPFILVGEVD